MKKDINNNQGMNRRCFMGYFSALGLSTTLLPGALAAVAQEKERITVEMIRQAEKIAGLKFTGKERKEIVEDLNLYKNSYEKNRELHMKNHVPLPLYFNPVPPGKTFPTERKPFKMSEVKVKMASKIEDLCFYPVTHLAKLIETRKVTSTELTKMYLARLKKYGSVLKCVVTLTADLALKQARRRDREISSAKYRGPLHGIPWGVKDLFATKGYRTTWGAEVYKNQVIDTDATIVSKLEEAGAVLAAKLSVGELATGDRWFGGRTLNPWNKDMPSGGSSAGPVAAVTGGLVGFSIGTETIDSLIGPSRVCGAVGLRPTFGRVSRHGCMTTSWSLDKVGPICRSAEDCAVVFNSIYGPDHKDHSVIDLPFNWDHNFDVKKLRVGFIKSYLARKQRPAREYEEVSLKAYKEGIKRLTSMGIELIPIVEPDGHWERVRVILTTEAAAVFDDLTLDKRDKSLTRSNWAKYFRRNRFVPAVEYLQSNRARTLLIREADKLFERVDIIVGNFVVFSNFTGLPEVVIPHGFNMYGTPRSLHFTGKLFGEAELLALAHAYQKETDYHLKHPQLY